MCSLDGGEAGHNRGNAPLSSSCIYLARHGRTALNAAWSVAGATRRRGRTWSGIARRPFWERRSVGANPDWWLPALCGGL